MVRVRVKRADVSDAAFNQSIEQACGNRASLGADYCGAVAGLTRRLLRFDNNFHSLERDRNHLTDIPISYGDPPAWRFYKNKPRQDLAAVPREELRAAIRKCHQTLWEGGRRSPILAFGEFSKLVFIKHLDEKNPDIEDGQPYEFQRRDGETADRLAERIERLYSVERQREPGVFADTISVDPPILAQAWSTSKAYPSTAPTSTPRASPSRSSWEASSKAISASTSLRASLSRSRCRY